jgi:GTPase
VSGPGKAPEREGTTGGGPVAPHFRAGFAALVGRPNVGKSTLLNALIGEKLSIVTPRPQTTRHRVLGVLNSEQAQIAFVDTPGLHRGARRALNRAMNRTAAAALHDADLAVLVLEATKWTAEDDLALQRIRDSGRPAIAAVNKIDRVRPREKLLPFLAELGGRHAFAEMVPVSGLKRDNLESLIAAIGRMLPESPLLFPLEQRTDRDSRFRIAETIREKLTLELQQELPYGIAVEIERAVEEDGQLIVDASIWVDRAGQKPIVIGARGERLKRVGRAARLELNRALGRRLHLALWVKVREGWADSARALQQLGLDT